jgi:hypothetical protein
MEDQEGLFQDGKPMMDFDYKNLRLDLPLRMQISGSSGSGELSGSAASRVAVTDFFSRQDNADLPIYQISATHVFGGIHKVSNCMLGRP